MALPFTASARASLVAEISATSVIPANALLDENNNPILDESGDYILAE